MSDSLRSHNLNLIKSVVDDVRTTQKNPQMVNVFFNPKGRNPLSEDEIEYALYEDMNRNPSSQQNIYALFNVKEQTPNKINPVVNFNIDVRRPIKDIFTNQEGTSESLQLMSKYTTSVTKQNAQFNDMFQKDEVVERYFNDALRRTHINRQNIINNNPTYNDSNERDLLNFIVGHELAHLSFAKRNQIDWSLIQNINLSPKDYEVLNSAFYSLNRGYYNYDTQHGDANYMSTRDEIHSDIAGLFMMANRALNNGTFNEINLMNLASQLGQSREKSNVGNDINGYGSHNSSIVFENNNIQKIFQLAKDFQRNPQLNINHEIMSLTENLFIQTLRNDGIIIKNDYFINSQVQRDLESNRNNEFSIANVYAKRIHQTNQKAEEMYDGCRKEVLPAYKNSCGDYLNGNQLQAVDSNNDKILDFDTVQNALINKSILEGKTVKEMQEQTIRQEGEALERFINVNNLKTMTTGHIGTAVINLNENKLEFK